MVYASPELLQACFNDVGDGGGGLNDVGDGGDVSGWCGQPAVHNTQSGAGCRGGNVSRHQVFSFQKSELHLYYWLH